jgi:hypothetical protein
MQTKNLIGLAAVWMALAGVHCQALALDRKAGAQGLQHDGREATQRGKAIVMLFSLPGCRYCEVVRRNYLAPLARQAGSADRYLVRELEMASKARLAGFHGERTSASALAQHYGVRVAPTVVLLDGAGNLLAPPLVGGDVSGMYGAYLDSALAEAAAKLAAGRPRPPHKTTRQLRLREIS